LVWVAVADLALALVLAFACGLAWLALDWAWALEPRPSVTAATVAKISLTTLAPSLNNRPPQRAGDTSKILP
jgi:hypothetical protein